MTLNLPPVVAEAEASSENGPSFMLVGGAGFSRFLVWRLAVYQRAVKGKK
jgi:hypothetical protein